MARVNGLFGYVQANDRRSLMLFGGFILAFHVGAVAALFIPLTFYDPGHAPFYDWTNYARRYLPLVTLAGVLLFTVQMAWHVKSVRRQVDFRFVDNDDEPRLCRIIEPLAISMGLPAPYVGLIESPALNSFACGIRRKDAAVIVTRGLIEELDDDELATVLAHELAHIRNGDVRLMAAANILLRDLSMLQSQNSSRISDSRQIVVMLLAPIFIPLLLIGGFLSELAFRGGLLSRLLISSAREFVADAEAVRATKNPAALVSALTKIEGRGALPDLPPELDAMMIDGAIEGPYATHPTIAERISALASLTGAMIYIAPSRRDTRPAASHDGVRAPTFGRRDAALPIPLAMSYRPGHQSLAAAKRVSRNSDRNILGLTRAHSLLALCAVAVAILYYRPTYRDVSDLISRATHLNLFAGFSLEAGQLQRDCFSQIAIALETGQSNKKPACDAEAWSRLLQRHEGALGRSFVHGKAHEKNMP